MKRKETSLETNLISRGYHLSHKTYVGKHSDKVDTYVYVKNNGEILFSVALDKNRNKIVHYSFKNNRSFDYTFELLETLLEINTNFHNELMVIYDFTLNKAKEIVLDLGDNDND